MEAETTALPILRTKLHRPRIAGDLVHRPHLLERLNQHPQSPLTVVSAPAGYGKTSLVGSWLEACDHPSAWVSLDENDNDLRLFLFYFMQAVQSIFPDAIHETQAMLNPPELPPINMLSHSLVNELDRIEKKFVLVLDDYHFISEIKVHELINNLLKHPPAPMQLVLVSRRDPPLSLVPLRATSRLTEIRVQDLRFSKAETYEFFKQTMKIQIDETTASILENKTEGWVTGLRFLGLSFDPRCDLDRIPTRQKENNQYVMEYVVTEVLERQPSAIQEFTTVHYLIKTCVET